MTVACDVSSASYYDYGKELGKLEGFSYPNLVALAKMYFIHNTRKCVSTMQMVLDWADKN